jgi:autotransporter-associated beta strand protein
MRSPRKRDRSALLIAISAASAATAAFPSLGVAQQWTFAFSGNSANWTTASNWSPNTVPNSLSASATFSVGAISATGGKIEVNTLQPVGSLHFNSSGSNGYTIEGSGTLSVPAGATFEVIGSTAVATINTGITAPSGGVSWNKEGAGTLVLGGASNYTSGEIHVDAGVLDIRNDAALNGVSIVSTAGTGIIQINNMNRTVNLFIGAGSVPSVRAFGVSTLTGSIFVVTANASVDVPGGSTFNLIGNIFDGFGTGTNGFGKSGDGAMIIPNVQLAGTLTIQNSGTLQMKAGATPNLTTSDTSVLAMAGTAHLDLTNNSMVVRNASTSVIHAMLASGYSSGAWTGPGIDSATAAADAAAHGGISNFTLGYAKGNQLSTWNGTSASFGGLSLAANDVAIKFLTVGDTNLDGFVDIAKDFANLVNGLNGADGFNSGGGNWFAGDFNFDGAVDVSNDFAKFVGGFAANGGSLDDLDAAVDNASLPLVEQQEMHNIIAAAPEPGMVGISLLAVTGAFSRRAARRRLV